MAGRTSEISGCRRREGAGAVRAWGLRLVNAGEMQAWGGVGEESILLIIELEIRAPLAVTRRIPERTIAGWRESAIGLVG